MPTRNVPLSIDDLNRRWFALCLKWGITPPIPEEEIRRDVAA